MSTHTEDYKYRLFIINLTSETKESWTQWDSQRDSVCLQGDTKIPLARSKKNKQPKKTMTLHHMDKLFWRPLSTLKPAGTREVCCGDRKTSKWPFFFFPAENSTRRRLSGKPSAGCKRHILDRINVLSCFTATVCLAVTLLETFPPRLTLLTDCLGFFFASRGFRARSLAATLVRYSRWQFDNSQRSSTTSPFFSTLLHLSCFTSRLVFSLPNVRLQLQPLLEVEPERRDAAEWNVSVVAWICGSSSFCINYNGFLCQHMPPILKLNEQVIQMTYKVKREQRDCQRLVCIPFPMQRRSLASCAIWNCLQGDAARHIF